MSRRSVVFGELALVALVIVLPLTFLTEFVGIDDNVYQEAGDDLAQRAQWLGKAVASSRLGSVVAIADANQPREVGRLGLRLAKVRIRAIYNE